MNIMNFATREVRTVTTMASIDRAISMMEEHGIHHLVVTENDRVVGMLSDRDILISTGWMLTVERQTVPRNHGHREVIGPKSVGQIMSHPVVCLTKDQSARDAARLMLERKIHAVPILQGTHLIGILSDTDLLKWLEPFSSSDEAVERFLCRSSGELMHASVITVSPETPLDDIAAIFRQRRIRHVPVVCNGQLEGIVSDRDVRRAVGWSTVREIQEEQGDCRAEPHIPRTAMDVMQSKTATASPSTPLRQALQLMVERRIHSLPIVDRTRLVGILTLSDFLKGMAQEDLL